MTGGARYPKQSGTLREERTGLSGFVGHIPSRTQLITR